MLLCTVVVPGLVVRDTDTTKSCSCFPASDVWIWSDELKPIHAGIRRGALWETLGGIVAVIGGIVAIMEDAVLGMDGNEVGFVKTQ